MKDSATLSQEPKVSDNLGENGNTCKKAGKRRKRSKKPQIEVRNDGSGETQEKENAAALPKMNAFQFMMNSRHKSIGSNSSGRDLDLNESTDSVLTKQELKKRRSRLESWAEQKGAAKRKRDEEIGVIINEKLGKRRRKLRRLLKINCQSDDEVITKKRRKCAVIESDDEENEKEKKNKGRKLTPKAVKSWKLKIKVCMDENKGSEETESEEKSVSSKTSEKSEICLLSQIENGDIQYEDCEKTDASFVVDENWPAEKEENGTSAVTDASFEECIIVDNEETQEGTSTVRRSLRICRTKPKIYDDFLSDDDDKRKEKKKVKVAPVFLKAAPKPKIDPKALEAKRQFLLSGVPSSLKKEMEKQQCSEEIDFDVFPAVSHVQQKSPNNLFWDLPRTSLKLRDEEIEEIKVKPFSKKLLTLENPPPPSPQFEELPTKIKNCKRIIRDIKSQHPDYPVYKFFNAIYNKSGYKIDKIGENEKSEPKPTPKRRGRPKKNSLPQVATPVVRLEPKCEENAQYAMWTEKYKPKSSSDIIGNSNSVTSLKQWLANWTMDFKKKKSNDSESEFDITDSDSRDSMKVGGNTVVLKGPTGSGKTAAVYAVCNELGFSVLEVNASSKRTGKRLLQELQEATRSHQLCKSENSLSSFIKENKERKEKVSKPKMCVLLVEDVDIIFEQDEGFTAALSQIITTTKRPIILTMTDEPCSSIQKLINYQQTIVFSALSSILSIWLQIVCLVEGLHLNLKSIEELLLYNKGDIRRTLLQLQLYVNSGGQLGKNENKNTTSKSGQLDKIKSSECISDDVRMEDDSSNLSDLKLESACSDVQIHHDCLEFFDDYKSSSLQHCNDLEIVWWNWSAMLDLPDLSNVRLGRQKIEVKEDEKEINRRKLRLISDCYDSLSFADVMCGKNRFHESLERRWRMKERDDLSLEENMSAFRDDGFSNELTQRLLTGRINVYKETYEGAQCRLNMAVPLSSEKRWRSKQLCCEEKLQNALPLSEFLSRKAMSLDYLPSLRMIARSEFERAANHTRRRFYHYLRDLGVRCGDATFRTACDVFKIWD